MSAWTGKIDSWNALCIPAWLYAVVIAATLGCGDSGTETVDIPAEGPSEPLIQTDPSAQELSLHPSMKDRPYDASIREIVEREDPAIDGWESEQVSELASKQFKLLGQAILDQAILESESKKLCTEDFKGGTIRPAALETVFDGVQFKVARPREKNTNEIVHRGRAGFTDAMKQQGAIFTGHTQAHFKFKIIRVKVTGDKAATRAYFQMAGALSDSRRVQVNSTWDCEWSLETGKPKLAKISTFDYEEIQTQPGTAEPFSDATRAAFQESQVLDEQLIHGRDHWYSQLEATIGVEGRGNGIAIADVNNDGLEDIYLCQPAALPTRLFLRNSDGTLRDVSEESRVDWMDSTRAALFVDLDNDGDQDLVLTHSTQLVLHENDGEGRFVQRATLPTLSRLFSLNAIDVDNDRDLDLYVCGYSGSSQTRPEDIFASPVPYHDANNGAPNFLFRNDGNWQFTDITQPSGLDVNNLRFSLASVWEDYDNDGDLDLYVANDFGRNNLYRNDQGESGITFTDVAAEAGVEDIGPGMSAAWGDANNDGLMDLYVSNMFSSAGSRITRQSQFKPGVADDDLKGFQRHARGNSLFINQGDGTFADEAVDSGTVMGRWAWGSLFGDLNNDGWKDIYVANGFVTADNNNDL